MNINISEFKTRRDLLKHIRLTYGKDEVENNLNPDKIVGSTEQLKDFGLDEKSTVLGIGCQVQEDTTFTTQELRDNHFVEKYGKTKSSRKRKGRKEKNS